MPRIRSLYLFVEDLSAATAFYALLGLDIENVSDAFARAGGDSDFILELGTAELTRSYDPNWEPSTGSARGTINFEMSSADDVDDTYHRMVKAGHRGHLDPCDPPWQARFAILEDPDGNFVGLHGPRDRDADRMRERGVPRS